MGKKKKKASPKKPSLKHLSPSERLEQLAPISPSAASPVSSPTSSSRSSPFSPKPARSAPPVNAAPRPLSFDLDVWPSLSESSPAPTSRLPRPRQPPRKPQSSPPPLPSPDAPLALASPASSALAPPPISARPISPISPANSLISSPPSVALLGKVTAGERTSGNTVAEDQNASGQRPCIKPTGLIRHQLPSGSAQAIPTPLVGSIGAVTQNPGEPVASSEIPVPTAAQTAKPATPWNEIAKGNKPQMKKKGTHFSLGSGEVCVKIPNEVIEKNKKSWDSFVLGQFYSDPPSHGRVHGIVNGIWSKQFRDISVSKMEGFSYLFRIPNVSTRNRVLNQRLWQIDGQTMFVAKWEPGLVPKKPELEAVPIWLELRNVPLQFFHEDGLEYIAGMVGDPKILHPMTENKTNLEVAKVLTVIDPRQPLPEAVNVQFESGEISRIAVSCPWMPPVCSGCKEIGHPLQKCIKAPVTCKECNSRVHVAEKCPKRKLVIVKDKVTNPRSSIPPPVLGQITSPAKKKSVSGRRFSTRDPSNDPSTSGFLPLEKEADVAGSGTQKTSPLPHSLSSSSSDVEEDSSDVSSHATESDTEPEAEFTQVRTRRQKLIQQGLQLHRPLTIGKRR